MVFRGTEGRWISSEANSVTREHQKYEAVIYFGGGHVITSIDWRTGHAVMRCDRCGYTQVNNYLSTPTSDETIWLILWQAAKAHTYHCKGKQP